MLYVKELTGVKIEDECDPRDYVLKKQRNMCRPDRAKQIMCVDRTPGKQTCERTWLSTTQSRRVCNLPAEDVICSVHG